MNGKWDMGCRGGVGDLGWFGFLLLVGQDGVGKTVRCGGGVLGKMWGLCKYFRSVSI